MSTEFASASYTAGQLNAIVKLLKKQAGKDGPVRFLRCEITVSEPVRLWCEHGGIIYFSVTSDGMTGQQWIKRLEDKGSHVGARAKSILRSADFKPTLGMTTEVAVLKGMLFEDDDRLTRNIRISALERKLAIPNAEIACLIRDKFTNAEIEAMGLWSIIAMHVPIKDSADDPRLLYTGRDATGRQWLGAHYGGPGSVWSRDDGLAFAVSQVGFQT